ncbi:MAG: hypothetical protein HeimC3_18410 [Candidatus Heimdallarchaeota archaeon LC_3]|nr:MAG: hypothetical protein HeimC3_18410 [Candidatus Heimdallarchaeota archaeon LC_3]
MSTIYCPQCGSQLKSPPIPKFCKYCGYKIKNIPGSTSTDSSSTRTTQPTNSSPSPSLHDNSLYSDNLKAGETHTDAPPLGESLDEPTSYSEPKIDDFETDSLSEEFPAIPADVIDILAGRLEVDLIKSKMGEILGDIEKIEQKLDIGLIDPSEAKDQIHGNKTKLDELKDKKNNITLEEIPFETYKKQLLEMKDKLMKLEEMKKEGKISRESVYEKLFKEYNTEFLNNQEKFDEEKRRFAQWERQLAEDVKNYKDHAELAITRSQLGEISEEQAQKDKEQYEIESERRELTRKVISDLLSE